MKKGIQTPMAQRRSTKIISMIKCLRTSRSSIKGLSHPQVSPVCGRVASAGDDLSVRIWDVTGHNKAVGHDKAVRHFKAVATSLVLPGHDGVGDEERPCVCTSPHDADAQVLV